MKMGMRLYKRYNKKGKFLSWYAELERGKPKSLKTKDEKEARRLYNRLKRAYLNRKIEVLTGVCSKSLGGYYDEFISWSEKVLPRSTFRANRLALDKLIHHAGGSIKLDRLSLRHIDLMIAEEKSKNLSPASINNYIRHAKASLNKAIEWQYVKANPLAEVKQISEPERLPRFMRKSDIPRFLASINDVNLRRLVVAYIATGRRRSELLNLRWKEVDLKKRRYIVRGKRNRIKTFPINRLFYTVLVSINKGGDRVFYHWKHPDTVSHLIKKVMVDAGFDNLNLHALRHTYASMKASEGKTLRQIQELLGHKDIKATQIYTHFTEDDLAEISEVEIGPVEI